MKSVPKPAAAPVMKSVPKPATAPVMNHDYDYESLRDSNGATIDLTKSPPPKKRSAVLRDSNGATIDLLSLLLLRRGPPCIMSPVEPQSI